MCAEKLNDQNKEISRKVMLVMTLKLMPVCDGGYLKLVVNNILKKHIIAQCAAKKF